MNRRNLIQKIRRRLVNRSFPRLQMSLMVSLTGAAGFVASYLLLQLGVTTLWLRYLLACGLAYGVFFGLLRLWMHWQLDTPLASSSSAPSLDLPLPSLGEGGGADVVGDAMASGGEFAGGGASTSFDDGVLNAGVDVLPSSGSSGGGLDLDLDVDSDLAALVLPVVLVIALGVMIFSIFSLISVAPDLLAELLLDGTLSAGLYRKLRHQPEQNWVKSALRHTIKPFLATTVLLTGSGWLIGLIAPEAHTLRQALTIIFE
jgi:hypothetical protein